MDSHLFLAPAASALVAHDDNKCLRWLDEDAGLCFARQPLTRPSNFHKASSHPRSYSSGDIALAAQWLDATLPLLPHGGA